MLRQAVFSIASKRSAIPLRHFATAATTGPKRALNKQQIVETPPSNTPPVPPPPVPPSGDGVASGLVAPALGIATVIAGGAYYFDVFGLKEEAKQTAVPTTEPAKEDVSEDPVYEVKSEGIGDLLGEATQEEEEPSPAAEDPVHEVKTTGGDAEAKEEPPASERGPAAGNRVLEINVPKVTQREVPPVRVIEHPASGNRVEMHVNKPKEKVPTAMDAAKELLKPEQRAAALEAAYKAIRVTQDTSLFEDLDHLTPSELKVRVVQLASEMKNQTKWEAVRLQEHLARKEKEVAEK